MSRAEVLAWNKRWSESDTQTLVRHLDRVGVAHFSRTAEDAYIRCIDSQNRTVMAIAPGYVTFPRAWVNDECSPDWPGITLSTLGLRPVTTRPPAPRAEPRRAPARVEPEPKFCPRCFLELTTTGTCGNCD